MEREQFVEEFTYPKKCYLSTREWKKKKKTALKGRYAIVSVKKPFCLELSRDIVKILF